MIVVVIICLFVCLFVCYLFKLFPFEVDVHFLFLLYLYCSEPPLWRGGEGREEKGREGRRRKEQGEVGREGEGREGEGGKEEEGARGGEIEEEGKGRGREGRGKEQSIMLLWNTRVLTLFHFPTLCH